MSIPSSSPPPFMEVALEAVKKIQQPLLLYGIAETIILIFYLVISLDVPNGLLPVVYTVAALPVLIAIGHFTLEYQNVRIKYTTSTGSSKRDSAVEKPVVLQLFAANDSPEFQTCIENLMCRAEHRIILIGTGLNILQREPFTKDILTRAANGQYQLEIYLADPTSPQVQTRLIEEEAGDANPTIGREGIYRKMDGLLRVWKDFKRPDAISIRLFTHYPTFALLIVDRDYFIYPYGYAALGNFSPVMRFSKDVPADLDVIKFLDAHYQRVKDSALDAEMASEIRNRRPIDTKKLHPFALYFIPPADSAFYQFGTKVLGYDIRQQKPINSPWQEQVGGAREFGFHLTLCDALYFLNPAQVNHVWEEIKFLAKEFRPFDLAELRLKPGFPDEISLAIVMNDPTGSLEALHYEFVHRVYRCAAASNYSLGLAKPTRDQDIRRARLMIERYRAPYILQRFRPHFTLLTNIPPGEQSKIDQEFEKMFSEQVREPTIRVEKLALMSRQKPDAPWEIKEEIELG